jgi:hypothetical protein
MMRVLGRSGLSEDGFTRALFQGWGMGSDVLLEQAQLIFSFRNKFTIVLPCGLADNYTFPKMWPFKSLTGYTDYGGYEKQNAHF